MDNKILAKHCFIRKDNRLYCSKCGQKQLQDTYNMKRHAVACDFKNYDFIEVFEDDNNYAYAFLEKGDKLYFYIFTIQLQLRPGFKDRYVGGKWIKKYEACFYKNKKEITEKGIYNIDIWFKKFIDINKIPCLNSKNPIEIIHNFFPSVLDLYSYGMFLDIYRQKGFIQKNYDIYKEYEEDRSNISKPKPNTSRTVGMKNQSKAFITSFEKFGEIFLEINIIINGIKEKVIISEDFCYSKSPIELKDLLGNFSISNVFYDYEEIKKFDKKYPSFMINNYLANNGLNLMIPLLGPNYNKCLELLSKSGLSILADKLPNIMKEDKLINIHANNIKDIFGLPIKFLRKLQTLHVPEKWIEIFAKLYKYNPDYINIDKFSCAYLDFIKYNNITHDKAFKDNYKKIKNVSKWSDEDIYNTLKYLSKQTKKVGDDDIYNYYKDYIETCYKLGEFIKGKTPKNLIEAHDKASAIYIVKADEITANNFKKAVETQKYKSLASSYFEDEEEKIEDEKYEIILPENPYDLIKESAELRHCVKTYIEKVSNKKTFILFLRKKENSKKPFATIEVLPNLTLIQLKAYCNTKAPKDAIEFVKKWAKVKGIKIQSYDIN